MLPRSPPEEAKSSYLHRAKSRSAIQGRRPAKAREDFPLFPNSIFPVLRIFSKAKKQCQILCFSGFFQCWLTSWRTKPRCRQCIKLFSAQSRILFPRNTLNFPLPWKPSHIWALWNQLNSVLASKSSLAFWQCSLFASPPRILLLLSSDHHP